MASRKKLRQGSVVRIVCPRKARELRLAQRTIGVVSWLAERSDVLELNILDRKVMLKRHQVEVLK